MSTEPLMNASGLGACGLRLEAPQAFKPQAPSRAGFARHVAVSPLHLFTLSPSCRPAILRCHRRGFTLLETALALIIVGVGVLAIVSAQQAFHRQNAWSTRAGIAAHLANEIRELTLNLERHDPVTSTTFWGPEPNENSLADYDDLDDFDGAGNGTIFSAALNNGPINAQRQVIPNMPGWTQIVTVANVQTSNINTTVADGTSTMMRIQVVVTYQGPQDQQPLEMTRVSWISPK